jgi:hypothetical protein
MTSRLARLESRLDGLRAAEAAVSREELEEALNDGYAEVLELEAHRARLSREITELAAEADHEPAAQRLRERALRLGTVERELERMRELLAELAA